MTEAPRSPSRPGWPALPSLVNQRLKRAGETVGSPPSPSPELAAAPPHPPPRKPEAAGNLPLPSLPKRRDMATGAAGRRPGLGVETVRMPLPAHPSGPDLLRTAISLVALCPACSGHFISAVVHLPAGNMGRVPRLGQGPGGGGRTHGPASWCWPGVGTPGWAGALGSQREPWPQNVK